MKNDNLVMHTNEYELARRANIEDHIMHKAKILHGEFLCSKACDNSLGPDWAKKTHAERQNSAVKKAGFKRNTLMTTADRFISGGNKFDTHLKDFDDLPRLSILNHYKRIKQIMNSTYVKGFAVEQKYRNRTKQDQDQDAEWAKYKEDKVNSQTMSTILRSLNTTKPKKKSLLKQRSEASSLGDGASAMAANPRTITQGSKTRPDGTPYSGIRPLQEAKEGEEVSNISDM